MASENQPLGRNVNRPGMVQVQSHMAAFPTRDPNEPSFVARVLKQAITSLVQRCMHRKDKLPACLNVN